MDFQEALELSRNAFSMALMSSAPILLVGLVLGLMISLFQAVTQLQEQTLTFGPKIAAMVIAAAVFIPWIANRMLAFTHEMLTTVPFETG